MTPANGLSLEERLLLRDAMAGPLIDRDPISLGLCLKLCGLKLLQRAGSVAVANGWRGSPHAFFLTREGWALLKAERGHDSLRRAG
jgi:hypothetical protein